MSPLRVAFPEHLPLVLPFLARIPIPGSTRFLIDMFSVPLPQTRVPKGGDLVGLLPERSLRAGT